MKIYLVIFIAAMLMGCASAPQRTKLADSMLQSEDSLPTRPELGMLEAISLAEQHIEDNQIDVSKHYLSKTHIAHTEQGMHWVVTWSLKTLSDGGQVFVLVHDDKSMKTIRGR